MSSRSCPQITTRSLTRKVGAPQAPIRSAVSRLFANGEEDEDLVTTRLDGGDGNYDLTAPLAARTVDEGASV